MYKFEINKIDKKAFFKLAEKDIMFITNPGRMGDEDGSTFIVKNNNEFIVYRVSGWMHPDREEKREDRISLDDVIRQFPKWYETWKHCNDDYKGKYKYLYMGFGNGLSVDNSIYSEFEPYLKALVEEHLEGKSKEERESLTYAAIYSVWKQAFIEMVKDKNTK